MSRFLSLSWHHHQLCEGYNDREKFINIVESMRKKIFENPEKKKKKEILKFPPKNSWKNEEGRNICSGDDDDEYRTGQGTCTYCIKKVCDFSDGFDRSQ